jgi:hypothetical protein
MRSDKVAYIEESPEEPGVRCLRIEESLSPAILYILRGCCNCGELWRNGGCFRRFRELTIYGGEVPRLFGEAPNRLGVK